MGCVLVTGASGGIGASIARGFAGAGHAVVLGAKRNLAAAEALACEIQARGGRALAVRADVTLPDEVEALFSAAEAALGPVEVLVNNAGVAGQRLFQDISLEEWNEMLAVNLTGAFLCSRRALPAMIREKRGSILNISSMWGQVGASCEVHYSAAKAGLIGMTKALAQEVGPSGVRVNCIAPGAIETAMLAGFTAADKAVIAQETPLGRLGTPEDVAAVALFLAGDGAGFITGQVIAPNGGYVV